jgi:two-component system, sensor histidine kinase and response regulator
LKASRGIEDIYELTYIRKDGSRFGAVVSVTALRDAQDAIIGYLLIGTDHTARRQVEEERKKLDQCVRDQHFYTRSLIESNTFSDYDDVKAETVEFDLDASVSETIALFIEAAGQKGIQCRCHISPDLPQSLRGDPKRLRKPLRLLVDNAVKFTSSGEIEVRVEPESSDGAEARLRFTVRDTGVGIPKKKQEITFSPFTQVDSSTTSANGGTGLGLTVCRRLVELLGGSLWVVSEPGAGSAFYFTGQFESSANPAKKRGAAPSSLAGGGVPVKMLSSVVNVESIVA